jgi:hypothetical protein
VKQTGIVLLSLMAEYSAQQDYNSFCHEHLQVSETIGQHPTIFIEQDFNQYA